MAYALRSGVSFCEASGRLVFLDLDADRYFALEAGLEQAFRAVAAERAEQADRTELEKLIESGLLHHTPDGQGPSSCASAQDAPASLLDDDLPSVRPATILRASAALLLARLQLRTRGLARVLGGVAERKAAASLAIPSRADLAAVAAAFGRSALLTRSHDQCLARSVAAVRWLVARGIAAELVVGVRVRPFAAHCWVQSGAWLVNDRVDDVRPYTPILVV